MELTLDLNKRYSYADYLTWFDDVRRELIEGFIKLFPAPRRVHAEYSKNILWNLESVVRRNKGNCKVYGAPFDVRLPKNGETTNEKIYTVVQPDICIVCDPTKLDDAGCFGAPDMIVEILSPSTAKRDLFDKYILYQESGVKEYWVVHAKDKAITVFLLNADGKYDNGQVYEPPGKVPVTIFDGYLIDLDDIFSD